MQAACRLLGVAESGYYLWRSRPPSQRAIRHAWLLDQIRGVHTASRGTYGARRVHAELTLGLGIRVGHNQVEMLMARAAVKGLPGNPRARPKHQTPTASDLVNRSFARKQPNQLWVTDITEHFHEGGQGVLRGCARYVLAASGRLVDRLDTDRGTGHQRARDGDLEPRTRTRDSDSFRSWDAIHLVGLHRPGSQVRVGAVDGFDR